MKYSLLLSVIPPVQLLDMVAVCLPGITEKVCVQIRLAKDNIVFGES